MPVGYLQARKGVRLQGPVVTVTVAGNGGAQILFAQSTFAAQIGARTFRLKRIKGFNNVGANTDIHIGIGAAGFVVDAIPTLHTFNGLNFDFGEADLPEEEFSADMMVWAVAAAVGAGVEIQVEVEELG